MRQNHIIGCILGTAAGDSIGLPYEGLSRRRAARLFGPPDRHRFLFGHGMVSDDTEHTCMVAQSLIDSGGNQDLFLRSFNWRLRLWLLSMPMGIGWATLRSIFRLWLGYGPARSGVFSAGNGPAMRAAIFGAAFDDRQKLCELVRASTRLTHTDPKAEYGALAVALAAQMAREQGTVAPDEFLAQLQSVLNGEGEEFIALVKKAVTSVNQSESTEAFASLLGLHHGVSGYVYHTVPVALHAWLAHQGNFRQAIISVIACGGDADTTAAIVGGIVGTAVGKEGIPAEWLNNLFEWPRSVTWMERLGSELYASLHNGKKSCSPELPFWGPLPRNLFALMIVLLHGFRRMLPPY